jgi:hypothetical protein
MGIKREAEAGGEITWEEIGRNPARAEHLSDQALRPLEGLHAIVGGYLRAAHHAGRRTGGTTTETRVRSSA